jgi:peptidoglycan/LPS O-acetylase OafA/YrhL
MPALDGLRAVAIALVVGYHSTSSLPFGLLGVDVFFVLSGFLITGIIAGRIQSGGFSRKGFYARRAVRLVPALLVTVLVFVPLGVEAMGSLTWVGAIAAVLYLSPLVPPTIFEHTWTLAIEEWFYLVWPVVLAKFFRDRLTLRQAARIVGSLAVLEQAAFILGPGSLVARPSALLAGAAVGLWWLAGGRVRHPAFVSGVGVSMILVGSFAGSHLWGPVPFWLAVGGSALVVASVASGARGPVVGVLEVRWIVAIGVVSYEWYLVHFPMLRLGDVARGPSSYFVLVPLSLVLAFGLHYALVPLQARLRARLGRVSLQTT